MDYFLKNNQLKRYIINHSKSAEAKKNYDWIGYIKRDRINKLVFKKQIVQLYQNGKNSEKYENSGSSKENRSKLDL